VPPLVAASPPRHAATCDLGGGARALRPPRRCGDRLRAVAAAAAAVCSRPPWRVSKGLRLCQSREAPVEVRRACVRVEGEAGQSTNRSGGLGQRGLPNLRGACGAGFNTCRKSKSLPDSSCGALWGVRPPHRASRALPGIGSPASPPPPLRQGRSGNRVRHGAPAAGSSPSGRPWYASLGAWVWGMRRHACVVWRGAKQTPVRRRQCLDGWSDHPAAR
jgi:hypothetical protein